MDRNRIQAYELQFPVFRAKNIRFALFIKALWTFCKSTMKTTKWIEEIILNNFLEHQHLQRHYYVSIPLQLFKRNIHFIRFAQQVNEWRREKILHFHLFTLFLAFFQLLINVGYARHELNVFYETNTIKIY